ncbi:hypothetical protein ACBI99_28385 [Nonomuraea sp. ATR24]|nr:hypothetical protein [Nonomuraea ceibae]
MLAMIVLILVMVVTIAVTELIMLGSPDGKESVESPTEIVGD